MGVWLLGAGVLKIKPKPDINTIIEYVDFSNATNPYLREERFANPWFFDEDYNLQSYAGKMAEPSVWLKYVKEFFEQRGFKIEGDAMIIGECDDDFWELSKEKYEKYLLWKERKSHILCCRR